MVISPLTLIVSFDLA